MEYTFEIPDEYAHVPDPEYIKAGYFVLVDPKLFPDGIIRKKVMVTEKGLQWLKKKIEI